MPHEETTNDSLPADVQLIGSVGHRVIGSSGQWVSGSVVLSAIAVLNKLTETDAVMG
jgi:hypothetical protein